MSVTLPPKLYKYRNTGELTESIFSNRKLYFAKPLEFNDPFDCGFHVLCGGEMNQRVFEATAFRMVQERHPELNLAEALEAAEQVGNAICSDHMGEATQMFHEKLAAETDRKVGILSLTERNDDILMWSHYADCHKGICIEFRTDVEPSLFKRAMPVVYSQQYPHLDLREVVTNDALRASAPWMLTKSSHWEYEKEWRVLDFEAGPGVRSFPAECLSAVILGCHIPKSDKAKVMRWASSLSSKIAFHQATKSPSHFRLDFERID